MCFEDGPDHFDLTLLSLADFRHQGCPFSNCTTIKPIAKTDADRGHFIFSSASRRDTATNIRR